MNTKKKKRHINQNSGFRVKQPERREREREKRRENIICKCSEITEISTFLDQIAKFLRNFFVCGWQGFKILSPGMLDFLKRKKYSFQVGIFEISFSMAFMESSLTEPKICEKIVMLGWIENLARAGLQTTYRYVIFSILKVLIEYNKSCSTPILNFKYPSISKYPVGF